MTVHVPTYEEIRQLVESGQISPEPIRNLQAGDQVISLDASNLFEATVAIIQGFMDACGLQYADSMTNEKGHTIITLVSSQMATSEEARAAERNQSVSDGYCIKPSDGWAPTTVDGIGRNPDALAARGPGWLGSGR